MNDRLLSARESLCRTGDTVHDMVFAKGEFMPETDAMARYSVEAGLYVSFVVKGTYRLWWEDAVYTVPENGCFYAYSHKKREHLCQMSACRTLVVGAFFAAEWLAFLARSPVAHGVDFSLLTPSVIANASETPMRAVLEECLHREALLSGGARKMFRCGKALEFLSLLSCDFGRMCDRCDADDSMLCGHREKSTRIRDILERRMADPPSLSELAREVGLSVKKLNAAFRSVYGATVFGYLAELRLQHAYRLIAERHLRVSSAAYAVGLEPAYLSYAFRRRFGVAPSALRRSADEAHATKPFT